jgi:hypothetical protein
MNNFHMNNGLQSKNYGLKYNSLYAAKNSDDTAKTITETPQTGLQAQDYLGLGLQLYGASRADAAAEEEQKKLEAQRQQDMEMQGRAARTEAQQFETQDQNTKRQMNMNGMEFLANQRAEVMKNRRSTTLRNSFAQALSGGN